MRQLVADTAPDYIFHLAAQAAVSLSFADPSATLITNIVGQVNVLQACLAPRINPVILIVGSGDEYGMVRPEDLPIKETTPLRPTSPYSVSKIAQDMLGLQYFLSHRLRCVRVRPFNHIGPRQSDAFVVASFARQIAEAEAGFAAACRCTWVTLIRHATSPTCATWCAPTGWPSAWAYPARSTTSARATPMSSATS